MPPDIEHGTYQVDFESLIRVLGENLYANPKAAIRELIQNASDSCVRRSTIETFTPAIRLRTVPNEHLLIIEDNGAGMIQADVVRYLASIGAGLTREERARLQTSDQAAAQMLIGQFGIGFLSAFVVAQTVVVDTFAGGAAQPVRWICEGTSAYTLERGKRREQGATVALYLKPERYDLLDAAILSEAIIRFADFIAFPIFVNDSLSPVNRMHAPWHNPAATLDDYAAYIRHRYGVEPIALEPVRLTQGGVEAQGVVFVPPRRAEFSRRMRTTDLFVKRMYVGEDANILPEWGGWVCAVLDCPSLDLVASREAVMSARPSYHALHRALADVLTGFVQRLANTDRPAFLEIIAQHEWPVLVGAIRSNFFFDQVKDLLPLPSDMGRMTLPDYLARVPARLGGIKTVYYVPEKQQADHQHRSLFRAQGVPIYRADVVVEEFLHKYAERTDNVSVRPIVSGVVELLTFVSDARWRTLEESYRTLGIAARAARFEPAHLPAMVVRQPQFDPGALLNHMIAGNGALDDLISRIGHERSDAYALCINVDNPIIAQLAVYQGDPTVLATVLQAIYASALLAAGVELTADLSQAVAQAQMALITLVLAQEQSRTPEHDGEGNNVEL